MNAKSVFFYVAAVLFFTSAFAAAGLVFAGKAQAVSGYGNVDFLYNQCMARCEEPGRRGTITREGCEQGCAKLRGDMECYRFDYSSASSCAKAAHKLELNKYERLEEHNEWCAEKFDRLYDQAGCEEAGEVFYGALTERNFCGTGEAVPAGPAAQTAVYAAQAVPAGPEGVNAPPKPSYGDGRIIDKNAVPTPFPQSGKKKSGGKKSAKSAQKSAAAPASAPAAAKSGPAPSASLASVSSAEKQCAEAGTGAGGLELLDCPPPKNSDKTSVTSGSAAPAPAKTTASGPTPAVPPKSGQPGPSPVRSAPPVTITVPAGDFNTPPARPLNQPAAVQPVPQPPAPAQSGPVQPAPVQPEAQPVSLPAEAATAPPIAREPDAPVSEMGVVPLPVSEDPQTNLLRPDETLRLPTAPGASSEALPVERLAAP